MEQTLFVFSLEGAGGVVTVSFLLAWSDDCDLAGQQDSMMAYIEEASHARWKVKSVSPEYMLGVRRTITFSGDAWIIRLTQEEYIDGVVGAYQSHLVAAGWHRKSPETPVPKGEYLSLADDIPEAEWKEVTKMGFRALCGTLIWPSRFTHKEISQGISMCCRVMSKPSRKAWGHAIQMVAWLRDHKKRGMCFRSDFTEHGLVAMCDASNKTDKHDSRCQHSHVVMWCGGTLGMVSAKLPGTAYGSPGNEYSAIRWAAAKVRKFRNIFEELGLAEVIAEPTLVYVDNNVAIHWHKTGKITDGNQYLDLAYHQPREWERERTISIRSVHTEDNVSDLGSKPCGPVEYSRFLNVLCGIVRWVIKFPRETMSFT